jgi:N-acetylmuramoyl-L-alanine amidase
MILAAEVARPRDPVLVCARMRPQGCGLCRHRAAARRARSLAALVIGALGVALAGCAGVAPRPQPAPPLRPSRPRPGYERLADSLAALDSTALVGRRIALDPGHGGFFKGSLGVHGLTEAEVNLAVALKLRELLAARGAQVLLTRSSDRDYLSPADSTLRSDLAERARLANAWGPDLFLSIHHNADPGGAHDVNETQTYYKLGDDGPSLDAAESVHRALVHNVGIEKNKVVPGNYFVLRNVEAPAILTESSFLTNPDVEARLALPEKQELEAEALLIGLSRYFARRVPVVRELVALDPGRGVPDTLFRGPGPMLRARIEGAFDRVELRLDGDPVPVIRRDDLIEWRPDRPVAPGPHRAALRVRLGGQGAARERMVSFTVARPVQRLAWQAFPAAPPRRGGWIGVRVQALDAFGFAVPDTLRVRFRARCACDSPHTAVRRLEGGVAWGYLKVARRRPKECAATTGLTLDLPDLARGGRVAPAARVALRIPAAGAPAARAAFLTVAPADSPLTNAPEARDFGAAQSWINRDGFALFPLDRAGRVSVPALAGYRPWADDSILAGGRPPLRWAPIADGALIGRRIVIDPDGGGEDPAGQGPSGSRAASVNLEVARILAGFLSAAGAQVMLTRTGDQAMSDVQRVQAAEGFRPDRFLRIAHRAEPPRLGYYFSSATGRRWAERAAQELARAGLLPRLAEDAQYPLQQVSCTALYAAPARIDSAESALLAPGALRAEAYALFLALAREWAGDPAWAADSVEVRDEAGRAAGGVAVLLGGALVLETDAAGRARFARTEPGPLSVEARIGAAAVRRVLLDSDRGIVLTGSAGR